MTSRKETVEAYIDGFRRTDHQAILACLADDIVWVLHGYRMLFVFTEVFTFTGDRIGRLETFHINLGGPSDAMFTAPAG